MRILAFDSSNFRDQQVIYVDPIRGNDSNPGNETSPVKTLRQALKTVSLSAVHIYLNPGTYREGELSNQPYQRDIVIEAKVPGKAILSGTELLGNWEASTGSNTFITTYRWPATVDSTWHQGVCNNPNGWPLAPPITFRREMLFLNGLPLTQVLSIDDLKEGTFFIKYDRDHPDRTSGQITARLAKNIDPNHSILEIAAHDHALNIKSTENWSVQGLVFRGYGNCMGNLGALNIYKSDHIDISHNQFVYNNASGLHVSGQTPTDVQGLAFEEAGQRSTENSQPGIPSRYISISDNLAEFNGFQGISVWTAKNIQLKNNNTFFNGTRAAMAGYYSFISAGMKVGLVHDGLISGNSSRYNIGHGIWLDDDNQNIEFSNNVMTDNFMDGGRIEISQGPIQINKNLFCFNNSSGNPFLKSHLGGGLEIDDSTKISVTDNLFYQNFYSQFFQSEDPRSWTNFEDLQNYSSITNSNIEIKNNGFKGMEHIAGYEFAAHYPLSPESWFTFKKTLLDAGNKYWSGNDPAGTSFANVNNHILSWADYSVSSASIYKDFNDIRFHDCAFSIPSEISDYQLVIYQHSVVTHFEFKAGEETRFQTYIGIRNLNFLQNVNISIGELPQGLHVTLGSSQISERNGYIQLSIQSDSSLPKGYYPITFYGTSSGLPAHMVTIGIQVQ